MMYKEIPSFDEGSKIIGFDYEDGLNKVASLSTHIPDKLAKLILEIERNPDPDFYYLYDRALGAGEVYGPNNNADWFSRKTLIEHHPTFETDARLYRHHQNKDPNKSIGSVVGAAYNHPLDVVDLIIKAPRSAIENDVRQFEARKRLIATSMGAKVPKDICSVCAHEARSRAMYCAHLKYHKLKFVNGRHVYAINPTPRFVDISIVIVPAAPESAVLRKIASTMKTSEIEKEDVGGNIGGTISPKVIEATYPLDEHAAIHTLHDAYGTLRPDEFQAVLRKDASLVRPGIDPYVTFEKVSGHLPGYPVAPLVEKMKSIKKEPSLDHTKVAHANFLSPEEKIMYLQYRQTLCPFSQEYFR